MLEDKLRNPPDERFRLLVLLPAKPNNGNDDTRGQPGVLAAADDGGGRFLACTPYRPGDYARPVYVHAKIGIVDDRWLTIGSANLKKHSLFNDTEMNIVTHDQALAKATRLRPGANTSTAPRQSSITTQPRSSTAAGGRSQTSNSNAADTGNRRPTSCCCCRASPAAPTPSAARSTASSSTAEPGRDRHRASPMPKAP